MAVWITTNITTGLMTLSPDYLKIVLSDSGGYCHRRVFRDAISQAVKLSRVEGE